MIFNSSEHSDLENFLEFCWKFPTTHGSNGNKVVCAAVLVSMNFLYPPLIHSYYATFRTESTIPLQH